MTQLESADRTLHLLERGLSAAASSSTLQWLSVPAPLLRAAPGCWTIASEVGAITRDSYSTENSGLKPSGASEESRSKVFTLALSIT